MSRRIKVGWYIIGVCLGIFVISFVTIIVQGAATTEKVSDRQVVNTQKANERDKVILRLDRLARAQTELLKEVRSCTTPQGACSKRGKARGDSLAAAINQSQTAAAAAAASCAKSLKTDDVKAIYRCTRDRMPDILSTTSRSLSR